MATIQRSPVAGLLLAAAVAETASLATGVNVPSVERGDPDGTLVVFVHGITGSWRSWEQVLPCLPESHHAYALTQRGHSVKTPARVWQASWRAMIETGYSAELATIASPVLMLWGDRDPLCPRGE